MKIAMALQKSAAEPCLVNVSGAEQEGGADQRQRLRRGGKKQAQKVQTSCPLLMANIKRCGSDQRFAQKHVAPPYAGASQMNIPRPVVVPASICFHIHHFALLSIVNFFQIGLVVCPASSYC